MPLLQFNPSDLDGLLCSTFGHFSFFLAAIRVRGGVVVGVVAKHRVLILLDSVLVRVMAISVRSLQVLLHRLSVIVIFRVEPTAALRAPILLVFGFFITFFVIFGHFLDTGKQLRSYRHV